MNSPKMRQLQSANRALHVKLDERDHRIGLLEHKVHVLQEPRDTLVANHSKEIAALRGIHEQMLAAHDRERAELRAQIVQLQADLATHKQRLATWESFGAELGNRLNETRIATRPCGPQPYDHDKNYMTAKIEYPGTANELIGKPFLDKSGDEVGKIIDAVGNNGICHILVESEDPLMSLEPWGISMGCTSRT